MSDDDDDWGDIPDKLQALYDEHNVEKKGQGAAPSLESTLQYRRNRMGNEPEERVSEWWMENSSTVTLPSDITPDDIAEFDHFVTETLDLDEKFQTVRLAEVTSDRKVGKLNEAQKRAQEALLKGGLGEMMAGRVGGDAPKTQEAKAESVEKKRETPKAGRLSPEMQARAAMLGKQLSGKGSEEIQEAPDQQLEAISPEYLASAQAHLDFELDPADYPDGIESQEYVNAYEKYKQNCMQYLQDIAENEDIAEALASQVGETGKTWEGIDEWVRGAESAVQPELAAEVTPPDFETFQNQAKEALLVTDVSDLANQENIGPWLYSIAERSPEEVAIMNAQDNGFGLKWRDVAQQYGEDIISEIDDFQWEDISEATLTDEDLAQDSPAYQAARFLSYLEKLSPEELVPFLDQKTQDLDDWNREEEFQSAGWKDIAVECGRGDLVARFAAAEEIARVNEMAQDLGEVLKERKEVDKRQDEQIHEALLLSANEEFIKAIKSTGEALDQKAAHDILHSSKRKEKLAAAERLFECKEKFVAKQREIATEIASNNRLYDAFNKAVGAKALSVEELQDLSFEDALKFAQQTKSAIETLKKESVGIENTLPESHKVQELDVEALGKSQFAIAVAELESVQAQSEELQHDPIRRASSIGMDLKPVIVGDGSSEKTRFSMMGNPLAAAEEIGRSVAHKTEKEAKEAITKTANKFFDTHYKGRKVDRERYINKIFTSMEEALVKTGAGSATYDRIAKDGPGIAESILQSGKVSWTGKPYTVNEDTIKVFMPALTHPKPYEQVVDQIMRHNSRVAESKQGHAIPDKYLDYNAAKILREVTQAGVEPDHLTTSQGEKLLTDILREGAKEHRMGRSDSCVKKGVIPDLVAAHKTSLVTAYEAERTHKAVKGRGREGM